MKNIPPHVNYAILKYQWAAGKQTRALEALKIFTTEMAERLEAAQMAAQGMNGVNDVHAMNGNGVVATNGYANHNNLGLSASNPMLSPKAMADHTVLLARCFLKQGEWQVAQKRGDWQHDHVDDVLASYRAATHFNPNWYRKPGMHGPLRTSRSVQAIGQRPERESVNVPQSILIEHVVPAVHGFFKSIALSDGSSLQDTLRLLTLWFAHGGSPEVNAAVTEGFASVSVDTWLEVIPQLSPGSTNQFSCSTIDS